MKILNIFKFSKDPFKHCEAYKKHGCCHVDGYLCNVDMCNMSNNTEEDLK